MPPTIVLIAIVVLVAIGLVYGYRTLTALLVVRSLPAGDTEEPPAIVDGEPIALTGDLVVEQPVQTGDAAVEDTNRSVGAYIWRTRFPDNGSVEILLVRHLSS